MKVLLILITLIFIFPVQGQDVYIYDEQEETPDYVEATMSDEEMMEAQEENIQREEKVSGDCVCPKDEIEQEILEMERDRLKEEKIEAEVQARVEEQIPEPSLFPPGTTVNMMPAPTAENPAKVQVFDRQFPEGYVEKLPPGFSNDAFAPIGPPLEPINE